VPGAIASITMTFGRLASTSSKREAGGPPSYSSTPDGGHVLHRSHDVDADALIA